MKKIVILGGPGSGKTFCAKKLSQKLNIPVYHLDDYYYKPNWVVVDRAEFIAKQMEIIRLDAWIIDGNSLGALSERLTQADTVIFLDIPRYQRIPRIVWRDCILNNSANLPPGCIFSWRQFLTFFTNNVWFYAQRRDKILRIIGEHPRVQFFHLRSSKEVDVFLEEHN